MKIQNDRKQYLTRQTKINLKHEQYLNTKNNTTFKYEK